MSTINHAQLARLLGAPVADRIFALRDGCLTDSESNVQGARELLYAASLPPGVPLDLYRDRLVERLHSALGNSGVNVAYETELFGNRQVLRVTLTGDALTASHNLDREQEKADNLLAEQGAAPSF